MHKLSIVDVLLVTGGVLGQCLPRNETTTRCLVETIRPVTSLRTIGRSHRLLMRSPRDNTTHTLGTTEGRGATLGKVRSLLWVIVAHHTNLCTTTTLRVDGRTGTTR